jgi:apolipoprotein N-acyltransferase
MGRLAFLARLVASAEMFNLSSMLNVLLLLMCGAFTGLALPPIGWWWLMFVGFTTLHLLLHPKFILSKRQVFGRGLSFAFGYFVVAFHWIGFAFTVDAATYLWMMPFAVGGLALFMACYWAVALTLVSRIPEKFVPVLARIPVAIGLAEYVRGHLLTGFPWSSVGLISETMGGFVQVSSLIGMTGLTVVLLALAVLPVQILRHRQIVFPALLVLILPVGWLWGNDRVDQNPTQYVPDVSVRLVQPNIAQSDKWRQENAADIFNSLLELTQRPDQSQASSRVVIWPESAIPFLLDENADALQRIAVALGDNRVLLTGAIRRQLGAAGEPPYFTSILQIDSFGSVRGVYDKWRLVPGGEFLPFEPILSRLGFRKVVSLPESFTAGQGPAALNIPGMGRAAMLICYEAIFPHHLLPVPRPDWIVNVTNDGWFGQSVGPHQHLAQVRMRAIEQGLPIARAANTGISAMIDPVGRLIARSALDSVAVIDTSLPQALSAGTNYSKWGDYMFLLMLLVVVICFHPLRNIP